MEDKASQMLLEYGEKHANDNQRATNSHGCPVSTKTATMTVGPRGPVLLQDFNYLDEIMRFDHERIPERVVHANGAGAFGYFECTHDISAYTKASVFRKGTRTPVGVRFSTVTGERGSSDTFRDPRGFAIKFYTEEDGVFDLVCNNTPIFFVRDPILFPQFIHALKRSPVTDLYDANAFFDFCTLRPETCHQVSFLFSDRGTPDGYRHMNGYGSHTFKLVNAQGKPTWCKFHFKTDQGVRNLTADDARRLNGLNPNYAKQDLFNAIANGQFPSWTLHIQVMEYDEAERVSFNPFDVTKVWPHGQYPLIPVGKLVLNRNPSNYFAEVEQIAFSPAHMIPGVEPSPDKMLQGRLISYDDTHVHRLGINYLQLPVNRCPYARNISHRDGAHCSETNHDGAPNYFPNSFSGVQPDKLAHEFVDKTTAGLEVKRFETGDEDNFSQVGVFWRKVLDEGARARLVENMAAALMKAAEFIQKRAVENFSKCDEEYGRMLERALAAAKEKKQNTYIRT